MKQDYHFNGQGVPTVSNVRDYLLQTQSHVARVHYYLDRLGLEEHPEQPLHDITGSRNKLDPTVLWCLSLDGLCKEAVDIGAAFHRQGQHHHLVLEGPVHYDPHMLKVAFVDKFCGGNEARGYNHGPKSFEDIRAELDAQYPCYRRAIGAVLEGMMSVPLPALEIEARIGYIPDIGVSEETRSAIEKRFSDAVRKLRENPLYAGLE